MSEKVAGQPGLNPDSPAGKPGRADGDTLRRLIADGLAQHQAGRLEQAERLYTDALALDPANANALYLRGTVFFQTGRREAGMRELGAAIELEPSNHWALYNLGNALREQGELEAAVARYAEALRLAPDFPQARNNLGIALAEQGRLDEAVASYRDALRLAPECPDSLNNLGNALAEQGKLDEAVASYRDALRLRPDYPQARNNLGNALKELGRLEEAVASYRDALRQKPDYPQACNNLGNALKAQGKLGEAIAHYEDALRLQPDYPDALYNLGNALTEQGGLEEAVARYRAALALKPDYPDAWFNLGVALTVSGRLDEARRAFEAAVELAPQRGLYHRLLVDTGGLAPDGPRARRMEALAADVAGLGEDDRLEVHFALGALYADAGLPERSFAHLLEANRLKRGAVVYDEAAALDLFARTRSVFSAGLLAGATGATGATGAAARDSRLPVFVVGMPRSGTTLVEQILASHPRVFGAGELMDLPRLAGALEQTGGLGFPEAAAGLPRQDWERLGAAYLEGLRARAPVAARVIDKLPDNFLRLGLIRLALPGARIVHVVRDPVDTCLSCFSKLFTGQLHYSYDLAELGRFYRAYAGLMAHWRAVLPPQVLCEVRYEDVVADLEGQARRLLDHCGLDWDARCLAFHENKRPVRTASAAQVRRPLYASSVGRWGAFADLARPLLAALRGEGGQVENSRPGR